MFGHDAITIFFIIRQFISGSNKYKPIRSKKTKMSCTPPTANVQREKRLKQPLPKYQKSKIILQGRPTQLKQEVESKLHETDGFHASEL